MLMFSLPSASQQRASSPGRFATLVSMASLVSHSQPAARRAFSAPEALFVRKNAFPPATQSPSMLMPALLKARVAVASVPGSSSISQRTKLVGIGSLQGAQKQPPARISPSAMRHAVQPIAVEFVWRAEHLWSALPEQGTGDRSCAAAELDSSSVALAESAGASQRGSAGA